MSAQRPNDFTVSPVEEADIGPLTALAREIWYQHYPGIITVKQIEYMLGQRYSPEVIREQIGSAEVWWDKLVVKGDLGGFACYELADDPAAMKLDKLYIHQVFRGRGLGGALIEHVERASRVRGCSRLLLQVNKNNSVSIAVYRRKGFAIAKTVKMDIGGGFFMDDYVMVKDVRRKG